MIFIPQLYIISNNFFSWLLSNIRLGGNFHFLENPLNLIFVSSNLGSFKSLSKMSSSSTLSSSSLSSSSASSGSCLPDSYGFSSLLALTSAANEIFLVSFSFYFYSSSAPNSSSAEESSSNASN